MLYQGQDLDIKGQVLYVLASLAPLSEGLRADVVSICSDVNFADIFKDQSISPDSLYALRLSALNLVQSLAISKSKEGKEGKEGKDPK